MIREPAVSGQFYPSSKSQLSKVVEGCTEKITSKEKAIGIVSPHAGLMYSGAVAGAVYSRIESPDTFIMLGPNHTGMGRPVSIMTDGIWEIPTGRVSINSELADEIRQNCPIVEKDNDAHTMEHSLELQLPFIMQAGEQIRIVPIVMMVDSLDICKTVGDALADVIRNKDYHVTVVASSDMSHYVTDSVARSKDELAVRKILDLDPQGLYETVMENNISMCGVIPATTMLYAAKQLGATRAELIKYMTSGEVSGDLDHVVGYAGLTVS